VFATQFAAFPILIFDPGVQLMTKSKVALKLIELKTGADPTDPRSRPGSDGWLATGEKSSVCLSEAVPLKTIQEILS